MNDDHKFSCLQPAITSTPCGKSIGSMWDMLNSVISPIGPITNNVRNEKKLLPSNVINEKKLLPRPVQRNSVPRPSGQHTGKNVLNNTYYLAEYRSSAKHTGTHSQFARLEVIESDDDDDVPKIVKVSDKNMIRSLKKKKTSESHTQTHERREFKRKVTETVGNLASKVVEAENKRKYVKKTEVNVLKPKRISGKEQYLPVKEEETKIKKSVDTTVRCKPVNKKISLQPAKQTFQKENEPSIVVIDTPETGQYRLRKHKPELNSLLSDNSCELKSSLLIHQKGEASDTDKDVSSATVGENCRQKYKTQTKVDSSQPNNIPHKEEEPNSELTESLEKGQRNLRKRKHEMNSLRSTESNLSKSNELMLQKNLGESNDTGKDISSVIVSETCRQKDKTRTKVDSSQSNKIHYKAEEPNSEVTKTLEKGQRNLRKRKHELNSLRSIDSDLSKSNELMLQKNLGESSDTDKDVSSAIVSETCRQKYKKRTKVDSSRSNKIRHKEEELSSEITKTLEKGQHNLREQKHELNSLRNTESKSSNELILKKSESSDTGKDVSSAIVSETCRQKYKKQTKVDSSQSNKMPYKEGEPSNEIMEIMEREHRNLRNHKRELNSLRNVESNVSKSNKLILQKGVNETGDKENLVSSAVGNKICKQIYKLQNKMDSSQLKKISNQEECFSAFEDAVFHKTEGVAMATCVSIANFTAGYVEIDRQKLFSSKTTDLLLHVLEGEPEVTINKNARCVKPGTFVYIPPGSCYHIKNSCSEIVRLSYTKVIT